jgi:predicted SprT family Zn-dependent metalloprotease
MSNQDLQARILAMHNSIMQNARRMFSRFANAPEPSVYFYETGRNAGLAHGYSKVGYNVHVFAQDPERFINTTIAHEIAHIVCSYIGNGKGHCPVWKRTCRMLGGNGQRCFAADGINTKTLRNRKQYEYRGSCGTLVMMSDVRHNKMQRGGTDKLRIKSTRGTIDRHGFTGRVV